MYTPKSVKWRNNIKRMLDVSKTQLYDQTSIIQLILFLLIYRQFLKRKLHNLFFWLKKCTFLIDLLIIWLANLDD